MAALAAPRKRVVRSTAASSTTKSDDVGQLATALDKVKLDVRAAAAPRLIPKATVKASSSMQPARAATTAKAAASDALLSTSLTTVNNAVKSINGPRKPSQRELKIIWTTLVPALRALRDQRTDLDTKKQLEIEKAALIVIGACVDAGLFLEVLEQLSYVRESLLLHACGAPSETQRGLDEALSRLNIAETSRVSSSKASESQRTSTSRSTATSRSTNPSTLASRAKAAVTASCRFASIEHYIQLVRVENPGPGISDSTINLVLIQQHHAVSALLSIPLQSHEDDLSRLRAVQSALCHPVHGSLSALQLWDHVRTKLQDTTTAGSSMAAMYSMLNKRISEAALALKLPPSDASIFELRMYALQCLLAHEAYFDCRVRTAASDKALDMLARHMSATTSTTATMPMAERPLAAVTTLVSRIRTVILDCPALSHQAFSKAYEELVNLASPHSNVTEVVAPAEIQPDAHSHAGASPSRQNIDIRGLHDQLMSGCADIEAWLKSDRVASFPSIDAYLLNLDILQAWLSPTYSGDRSEKALQRICKLLERLRYHPERALSGRSKPSAGVEYNLSHDAGNALVAILSRVAEVPSGASSVLHKQYPQMLRSALACCQVLARKALLLSDLSTHATARYHLSRCVDILRLLSPAEAVTSSLEAAETAYRLGAALYNDNRHAASIAFLEDACTLAQVAVDFFNASQASLDTTASLDKDQSRAFAQASRQWELLGLAHQHIREWTDASAAFVKAIEYHHLSDPQHMESTQVSQISIEDSKHPLRKLMTRFSRLAIFDQLLSAQQASLAHHIPSWLDCGKPEQGFLLYWQSRSLDGMLSKSEALRACELWLDQAADTLTAANQPLALSRVLLRQLELSATTTGRLSPEELSQLSERILTLLADGSQPSALASQVSAFAKILICLDAIRRGDQSASKLLGSMGKSALDSLKSTVDAHPSQEPSSNKAVLAVAKDRSPAPARPKTQVRKALSPKQPSHCTGNSQVTPPRRIAASPAAKATRTPSHAVYSLDEPQKSLAILNIFASVLGIFGHVFLRVTALRLLQALQENLYPSESALASSALALEFARLGKVKHGDLLQERLSTAPPFAAAGRAAVLQLRIAAYHVANSSSQPGSAAYERARSHSAAAVADKATKQEKFMLLAYASFVCGDIALLEKDPRQALSLFLRCIRLCNRVLDPLFRHNQLDQAVFGGSDTFDASESQADPRPLPCDTYLAWDVAQLLADALLRAAQLYQIRGSLKPATFFLQQAYDLAVRLQAPRAKATVVAVQATLARLSANADSLSNKIEELKALASQHGGFSSVDVLLVEAQAFSDASEWDLAQLKHKAAVSMLSKLEKAFVDLTSGLLPNADPVSRGPVDAAALLPHINNSILCSEVAIAIQRKKPSEAKKLLSSMTRMAKCERDILNLNFVKARTQWADILLALRRDATCGMIRESVITWPALANIAPSVPDLVKRGFVSQLGEAELLLWAAVCDGGAQMSHYDTVFCGRAAAEAHLLQYAMRSTQVLVGQITSALESSTAVTLRREHADTLQLGDLNPAPGLEMQWPSLMQASQDSAKRRSRSNRSLSSHPSVLQKLHPGWDVLSLHLTHDKSSLVAVTHRNGAPPVVVQMPLNRFAMREHSEDHFGYSEAVAMLDAIRNQANATCQSARYCKSDESRRAWWTTRKDLEQQLASLLNDIQEKWFGILKHILLQPVPALGGCESTGLVSILRSAILSHREQRESSVQLDTQLEALLSAVPCTVSDEELEDLLHYAVDAYEMCGIQVAWDEVDVEQAVIDLRACLEERGSREPSQSAKDSTHTFLILDSSLHAFPWESLPMFEGRSMSRMPSLAFLQDRLTDCDSPLGKMIDGQSLHYILNPSNDLTHTQEEFAAALSSGTRRGIVGRAPTEDEIKRSLATQDIVLYFGHGGAEQYIRPQTVRQLAKCATTLLWGCSSGHLAEHGVFEASGTPWAYMMAGAPAVVGNLWDVTDKDIDRFAKTALQAWGLFPDSKSDQRLPLPQAIANARQSCQLRYLNGAAPVVWGIPVSLM